MRILFFGTPEFAVPSLQKLHTDGFEIISVVTQPDKPVGRKQTLTPSAIKIAAEELTIPVLQPITLKNDEARALITPLNPDIIVVVAYGKIIPPWLLALSKHGCVNVHPSLLPKYRGASPIPAPIVHGDTETGVTIMLMDEEVDHGPTLAQETVQLDGTETGESLSKKLSEIGAELLSKTLQEYVRGALQPREQNHSAATSTEILTRDHGKIDWNKSAIEVHRIIRAYYPWPGAWTQIEDKRLKIISSSVSLEPVEGLSTTGALFKTSSGELAVACNPGALILITVQPEGGNVMSGEDFARGYLK